MAGVEPITPEEALRAHLTFVIPNEIIMAVNSLLTEKCGGSTTSITIKQEELIDRINEQADANRSAFGRQELFEKHFLDFEPLFENTGWKVEYCKPSIDEDFEAYWTFESKRGN